MQHTKHQDSQQPVVIPVFNRGAVLDAVSTSTARKILVVDDGPETLNDYWLLLEEAGYEVTRCGGSLAALFAVVRLKPDLLIAELRTPAMNGLALAHELQAYQDTRSVPVIIIAAQDSPKWRRASLQAGCAGFFTRNLSPNSFVDEIKKALGPALPRVRASLEASNRRSYGSLSSKQRYEIGNQDPASRRRRQ
jgi:CheY-like chemotaxis protein